MQTTGHKDFFGKELFEGDTIALLEKRQHSVYIRKGVVIGRTPKMVKVRFNTQYTGSEEESTRDPQNVIKA